MRFWGKDEERGALLGAIGAIILFTFVFPDPDVDLGVVFPGNPPYGVLWYFLNPLYWTKRIYPMIVFAEWSAVTLGEWWLLKDKRGLVKLQIFSVAILMMLHAEQDVTVIMFGPFLFGFVVELLQKIPFPGTPQWACAFQGTGTDANAYLYPCLSNSTHFFTWNHIYVLTYFILVLWVVLPLILWFKQRHSDKFLKSCGMRVVKLLPVGGGRVCDDCSVCEYDGCTFHEKDVERGVEEKKVVSDPQTIRKQLSTSPTKSVSLLDALLLLAVGATIHDFASYYGLHIEPFHAFYYTLPAIGILVWMKWRRWKK